MVVFDHRMKAKNIDLDLQNLALHPKDSNSYNKFEKCLSYFNRTLPNKLFKLNK